MSTARDVADTVSERDALTTAFARLSAKDREVLALIAWEGLDVAGSARVMGSPIAAGRPSTAARPSASR